VRSRARSKFPHGTYCSSTASYSYGVVKLGAGVVHEDPGVASTSPTSSSFLVIGTSSSVSAAASDGRALAVREQASHAGARDAEVSRSRSPPRPPGHGSGPTHPGGSL
jgi:hypothetical protein